MLSIRRARPDEWEQARDLRLEMLADTPIAFLETLERAQAYPDAIWRGKQLRASDPSRLPLVVVDADGRWRGQCIGIDDPETPVLVSVYLSPESRGQGLLAELVEQVCQWLTERGRDVVTLQVHEDNPRAQRAYERLGFLATGASEPYSLDPSRRNLVYERPLS